MIVIILLTVLLVGYGAFEFASHRKKVLDIPVRIHVNGTRGKSSVTRLIAAGLRAGGVRTLAKVTGTLPRIIDENGLEIPIVRLHPTNIIEQTKVFRYFSKHKPDAIVIECMAVQPMYQWICEHQFVHATVGVITNSRMDHVIEMGPSIQNITNSLANTVPQNAPLFTAEDKAEMNAIFRKRAEKLHSEIIVTDENSVSIETMQRFSHVEHKSNVALALAICEHCGVDQETALRGMVEAHPDPGALTVYQVEEAKKTLYFLNALAANDPESTYVAWERSLELYPSVKERILLINTRGDRFNRSVQLIEMLAEKNVKFDKMISMGESTDMLQQHLRRLGFDMNKVHKAGLLKPQEAYNKIWETVEEEALVFALGNAGHGGLDVAKLFRSRRVQNG